MKGGRNARWEGRKEGEKAKCAGGKAERKNRREGKKEGRKRRNVRMGWWGRRQTGRGGKRGWKGRKARKKGGMKGMIEGARTERRGAQQDGHKQVSMTHKLDR
jgi:hypothetical protein